MRYLTLSWFVTVFLLIAAPVQAQTAADDLVSSMTTRGITTATIGAGPAIRLVATPDNPTALAAALRLVHTDMLATGYVPGSGPVDGTAATNFPTMEVLWEAVDNAGGTDLIGGTPAFCLIGTASNASPGLSALVRATVNNCSVYAVGGSATGASGVPENGGFAWADITGTGSGEAMAWGGGGVLGGNGGNAVATPASGLAYSLSGGSDTGNGGRSTATTGGTVATAIGGNTTDGTGGHASATANGVGATATAIGGNAVPTAGSTTSVGGNATAVATASGSVANATGGDGIVAGIATTDSFGNTVANGGNWYDSGGGVAPFGGDAFARSSSGSATANGGNPAVGGTTTGTGGTGDAIGSAGNQVITPPPAGSTWLGGIAFSP
jgi:hypothetical protein